VKKAYHYETDVVIIMKVVLTMCLLFLILTFYWQTMIKMMALSVMMMMLIEILTVMVCEELNYNLRDFLQFSLTFLNLINQWVWMVFVVVQDYLLLMMM
jgi:hypothetical protein